MSFHYSPRLQDVKLESLQTQLDYLNLMRLRHQQWLSSVSDPRVKELHSQIIEQLEQLTDQYSGLLGALHH